MSEKKTAKFSPGFQKFAIRVMQIGMQLYFGYSVRGRENIPEGACVVCANHSQTNDPVFVACALVNEGGMIRAMAKKELFSIPFLGRLITWLGAFPVDRGHADMTAIKTSMRELKAGKKLLIFPQGTRGTEENGAKEGAAMLAIKTGSAILPMYISENKRFRRHVDIVIGEAYMPPAGTREYGPVADDILKRVYGLREQVKA